MKKITIILLVLLLSGCTTKDENVTDMEIDVFDLITEYENLEDANSKYAGTDLTVSGVVISNVGGQVLENSYLSIIGRVICEYSSDDTEMRDIDKNRLVIIKGTVQTKTEEVNYIELTDCELVEIVTTPQVTTNASDLTDVELSDVLFQVIEITGTIQSIDQIILAKTTVVLEHVDFNTGIRIEFNNFIQSIIDQLSGIEATDNVIIRCVAMPYSSGDIGMLLFGFEIEILD